MVADQIFGGNKILRFSLFYTFDCDQFLTRIFIKFPSLYVNMGDLDTQLEAIFNEITSTLTEKHKFIGKVVDERVSRLRKFTKKADNVYFNYFKNCVDHFLNEEGKIYDEVSTNLNEDTELTDQILKTCSEIKETIDDTRKIFGQSHELSKGIETIKQRIQSHEQLQSLLVKLKEAIEESHSIVSSKHQEEAIVEDEI